MFHHISIAVDHPLHVANVLAEVLQGRCFPFPPHEGSYMVIVDDSFGTGIELYPADTQLIPEPEQVGFSSGNSQNFTSVHAALSISVSQEQIAQIADREGWLVRLCDRGPFKVLEFWVENKFMLELLTPEMAKDYLQFVANYEAFLNQAAPQLVEA
ncbi:hypothetical protein [Leptolyngbya sp. FACHB-711]|uniref:hypothetical protein n=1 Tax=unclassified Leptolyngbya TaxID=2650499 RepID=UPI001685625D|nr:hypothetical protein [Leptolyngbya sp. FACHB-711]MBD1848536.1 hypothetical protein [Cyanobacteria bacterium FACHB-502]MBD2022928.1 hypothetical protein [Leptolyngbya sp. FACHB-711]